MNGPPVGPGLAVSSSTGVMSLATSGVGPDDDLDVQSLEVATERRHAEELGPLLVELLAAAGRSVGELGWLAVDVGPGRFTGLRVGLATVRGLAFALDIPVVGLTSLEILAAGAPGPGPVTAVIDARRREVFQQVFVDGAPAGPARVGPAADLAAEARGQILGDGFDRYAEAYLRVDRRGGGHRPLVPLSDRHPRAADLLALAAGRSPRPGTEIAPVYLRDPDAKANIRTRPQEVAG